MEDSVWTSEEYNAHYWRKDSGEAWDEGCRISHGQATWFYSYSGPRENMVSWKGL